jgi:high-affinity iron transporter
MLASALIVFREVLEAALIVTIILAATRGVARRGAWIGAGIAAGVAGSVGVAAIIAWIEDQADGQGLEYMTAGLMFVAVAMLAWHVIWMSRHGRELAQQMKTVGRGVAAGDVTLSRLAIVVWIAVQREGAEVVVFLNTLSAGGTSFANIMGGLGLGVVLGVVVGAALYTGLLQIPIKHFFSVTNLLVTLLAAGMASQGVDALVQIGLLPPLGDQIWNTSGLLGDSSVLGQGLHALVGYTAKPNGIQLLGYAATAITITALSWTIGRQPARLTKTPPALRHGGVG